LTNKEVGVPASRDAGFLCSGKGRFIHLTPVANEFATPVEASAHPNYFS
jgi:hypothetical protein